MFTVVVCGPVSSGKTSLVNAIACYPVGTTSVLRETSQPVRYEFDEDANSDVSHLRGMRDENKRRRETGEYVTLQTTLRATNRYEVPLTMIDLPGVTDDERTVSMMRDAISGEADMVIYAAPASSAFETGLFDRVRGLVEREKDKGKLVRLIVVVTKFDDEEDDELNTIAEEARKKTGGVPVFRFSNHLYLSHVLSLFAVKLTVPNFMEREMKKILVVAGMGNEQATKRVSQDMVDFGRIPLCASGDWDDLILHIIDSYRERKKAEEEFAFSYLQKIMPKKVSLYEGKYVDEDGGSATEGIWRPFPNINASVLLASSLGCVYNAFHTFHPEGPARILQLVRSCDPHLAYWLVSKIFPPESLFACDVDQLFEVFRGIDEGIGTHYEAMVLARYVVWDGYRQECHSGGISERCKRLLSSPALWGASKCHVVDHTSDSCTAIIPKKSMRNALLRYHPVATHLGDLSRKTYRELCAMDILGGIRWREIRDYDAGIWLNMNLRLRDSQLFQHGHRYTTLDNLVFVPAEV